MPKSLLGHAIGNPGAVCGLLTCNVSHCFIAIYASCSAPQNYMWYSQSILTRQETESQSQSLNPTCGRTDRFLCSSAFTKGVLSVDIVPVSDFCSSRRILEAMPMDALKNTALQRSLRWMATINGHNNNINNMCMCVYIYIYIS